MTIKIDTSDYRQAHGKNPKGLGRWMFMVGRDGAWLEFAAYALYSEAKRQAVQFAKENGCNRIFLES